MAQLKRVQAQIDSGQNPVKLKEELIPILKSLHKTENERFPNSLWSQCHCEYQNHVQIKKENHRQPPSWTQMQSVINKILKSQLQEHIKKKIHHDQLNLIPEIQGWFNIHKSINVIYHMDDLKGWNYTIISRDAHGLWQKSIIFFMTKNPGETSMEEIYLSIIKTIFDKLIA